MPVAPCYASDAETVAPFSTGRGDEGLMVCVGNDLGPAFLGRRGYLCLSGFRGLKRVGGVVWLFRELHADFRNGDLPNPSPTWGRRIELADGGEQAELVRVGEVLKP